MLKYTHPQLPLWFIKPHLDQVAILRGRHDNHPRRCKAQIGYGRGALGIQNGLEIRIPTSKIRFQCNFEGNLPVTVCHALSRVFPTM